MTPRPALGRVLAAGLLGTTCLAVVAQTTTPTPEIYTCTDAKGRTLTSDRKIPECHDREQKILNPSGTTKTILKPALSAQERAELDAKEKAAQQARARLDEEKRRDRALLTRYPEQALHQKARSDAVKQIQRVQQTAMQRIVDLQQERTKLLDEMAFYAKNPDKAPVRLRQQIDAVTQALAAQGRFVTEKDNEVARIQARFDEELLRLQTLWRLTDPSR